jgi:hypothetical protein
MAKSLLCRLGFHRYVTQHTEDGGLYRACARCGHQDPGGPMIPPGGGVTGS